MGYADVQFVDTGACKTVDDLDLMVVRGRRAGIADERDLRSDYLTN